MKDHQSYYLPRGAKNPEPEEQPTYWVLGAMFLILVISVLKAIYR